MYLGLAIVAVFTVVVVKGGVTVVGIWLLVRLGRSVFPRNGIKPWLIVPQDYVFSMKVVWWSLVVFFIAETACWIAMVPMPRMTCERVDMIHSVASGFGMSVFGLGMYLYLDKKLLHYGEHRCIANRFCRGCAFEQPLGCKFHGLLLLIVLFIGLASVFPVWIPIDRVNVDPARVALPFASWNEWHDTVMAPFLHANLPGYQPGGEDYYVPESINFIEYRILPALALLLSLGAAYLLVKREDGKALKLLVLAIGFLAYSYLEIVLYRGTNDAVLGSLGHEVSELWFLITLSLFLTRAFSHAGETADIAPNQPGVE